MRKRGISAENGKLQRKPGVFFSLNPFHVGDRLCLVMF